MTNPTDPWSPAPGGEATYETRRVIVRSVLDGWAWIGPPLSTTKGAVVNVASLGPPEQDPVPDLVDLIGEDDTRDVIVAVDEHGAVQAGPHQLRPVRPARRAEVRAEPPTGRSLGRDA